VRFALASAASCVSLRGADEDGETEAFMEAREIFPVFSELHADTLQPKVAVERPRVISFSRPKHRTSRRKSARSAHLPKHAPPPPKRGSEVTLTYNQETRTDTQKAIHAVAYLLEWATESGNQPLEGFAADGLAGLLRKCASAVGRMFTITELRAAGGDPKELEERVRP